jgi:hypothetical protein
MEIEEDGHKRDGQFKKAASQTDLQLMLRPCNTISFISSPKKKSLAVTESDTLHSLCSYGNMFYKMSHKQSTTP